MDKYRALLDPVRVQAVQGHRDGAGVQYSRSASSAPDLRLGSRSRGSLAVGIVFVVPPQRAC